MEFTVEKSIFGNMKKYFITIEETISQIFEIDADSTEQAKNLAIEKYNAGEFVLTPGELLDKKIQISDNNALTVWEEF